MEPSSLNVQFVNETDDIVAATNGWDAARDSGDSDDGTGAAAVAGSTDYCSGAGSSLSDRQSAPKARPPPGKKTMGRVKIKMEYIKNKVRRYTTFSKRKTGIMKKAYELTVLTGTEVMLLVASETGHVYTFATRKLQPMITSENGKALIQTCLNSPDSPASEADAANVPVPPSASAAAASSTEKPDCSPAKPSAANHTAAIPPPLSLGDHTDKLHAHQIQMLSSFSEKLKDVQALDISQFVGAHSALPGKSSADTVAVNLRQECPSGVAASVDPTVHTELPETPFFLKSPTVSVQQNTKRPQQQQLYQIPGTNQLISLPVSGAGTESLAAAGAAVLYQTPSGLVFAPPSTSSPEGYVLSVPGTPAFALPPKLVPGLGEGSLQGPSVYNPILVKLSVWENMHHVQIKWKTVAIVLFVIIVIIILMYRVVTPYQQCSDVPDWSELGDYRDIDYYCNYPYLPVSGYEGESGSDDLRLVSVHVAIRHGDRSPLHSLTDIPNKAFDCHLNPPYSLKYDSLTEFSHRMQQQGHVRTDGSYVGYSLCPTEGLCGVGSLTPIGVVQHIMNGMFLRKAYFTKHKLFVAGDDSLSNQVLVRATTRTRTFQSAVAFMHGFAPEVDMSKVSVEKADNNTMCVKKTGHQCACLAVQSGFLDMFSVAYAQRSSTVRNRPASQRIAARLGVTVADLPKLSHVFDIAMSHFCHGMAVGCLGSSFVRDAFDVVDEAGRLGVSDVHYQHLARLKSQPLLYEIARRMERQVDNMQSHSSDPKFVLYSGHDSTVEPLAAAIGISNGVWPRYATRLVFELYVSAREVSSSTTAGIRVVYNGKDVTSQVSFCRGHMSSSICPLMAFLEFVNDSKFCGGPGHTGYDEACKSPIR